MLNAEGICSFRIHPSAFSIVLSPLRRVVDRGCASLELRLQRLARILAGLLESP
jgi:hypothetical protein